MDIVIEVFLRMMWLKTTVMKKIKSIDNSLIFSELTKEYTFNFAILSQTIKISDITWFFSKKIKLNIYFRVQYYLLLFYWLFDKLRLPNDQMVGF